MRIIFNEIRRSLRRTPHIALLFTLVFSVDALLFLVSIELQNARYGKADFERCIGTNICMVGLHADEVCKNNRAHLKPWTA